MPRPLFRLSATVALLLLGLCGCRDREVTSYRIPKEKDPAPMMMPAADGAASAGQPGATMANTPVNTAEGPGLTWSAPAHWTVKPASAMRKGSYAIHGEGGADADLSITAFPGDVGGDLANLNRWRGQIQLPPLAPADLGPSSRHLDLNGLHVTVVDFANSQSATPQRILGAIVPYNGATWFFKLMGPDALVVREKAAFEAFLQTVKAP